MSTHQLRVKLQDIRRDEDPARAQHKPAPLCQRAGAATLLQLPAQLSSHAGPVRNWLAALPDRDWHHVPALPKMPRPAGTRRRRIQTHSPGSHSSCPRHSPSGFPQMPYANWFFLYFNRSLLIPDTSYTGGHLSLPGAAQLRHPKDRSPCASWCSGEIGQGGTFVRKIMSSSPSPQLGARGIISRYLFARPPGLCYDRKKAKEDLGAFKH